MAHDRKSHEGEEALDDGVNDRRAQVAPHRTADHRNHEAIVVGFALGQHATDFLVDAGVIARKPERENEAEEHDEDRRGDVVHHGNDAIAHGREQARKRLVDDVLRGGEDRIELNDVIQMLDHGVLALHAHHPRTEGGEFGRSIAQEVDELPGNHGDHERKE